jgi:hypothetical protein
MIQYAVLPSERPAKIAPFGGELGFWMDPTKDTGRRTIRYDGLLFPPEQSFDKQIL